jgi:hypothetical protein
MESNQGQSFASPNDDGFWVDNKQKALQGNMVRDQQGYSLKQLVLTQVLADLFPAV